MRSSYLSMVKNLSWLSGHFFGLVRLGSSPRMYLIRFERLDFGCYGHCWRWRIFCCAAKSVFVSLLCITKYACIQLALPAAMRLCSLNLGHSRTGLASTYTHNASHMEQYTNSVNLAKNLTATILSAMIYDIGCAARTKLSAKKLHENTCQLVLVFYLTAKPVPLKAKWSRKSALLLHLICLQSAVISRKATSYIRSFIEEHIIYALERKRLQHSFTHPLLGTELP